MKVTIDLPLSLKNGLSVAAGVCVVLLAIIPLSVDPAHLVWIRWQIAIYGLMLLAIASLLAQAILQSREDHKRIELDDETRAILKKISISPAFVGTTNAVPVSSVALVEKLRPTDPRLYVDILDQRGGFASGKMPATIFKLRNEGGGVAHKIQIQTIDSVLGSAVFDEVDSIPINGSANVVPELERNGMFQKNDVSQLLRSLWNAKNVLTERYVIPCSVTYEDYAHDSRFETTFDLIYFPLADIMKEHRLWGGEEWPDDKPLLQVENTVFRGLS